MAFYCRAPTQGAQAQGKSWVLDAGVSSLCGSSRSPPWGRWAFRRDWPTSHTCTAAKQVPFLKLWMAWGLMEVLGRNCPQAPTVPPPLGASPGLAAAPLGVTPVPAPVPRPRAVI